MGRQHTSEEEAPSGCWRGCLLNSPSFCRTHLTAPSCAPLHHIPPPLQRLPAVLEAVIDEEQLQGLPLLLFGASSGGGIVLRLAQIMPQVQVCAAAAAPAMPYMHGAEGWARVGANRR